MNKILMAEETQLMLDEMELETDIGGILIFKERVKIGGGCML